MVIWPPRRDRQTLCGRAAAVRWSPAPRCGDLWSRLATLSARSARGVRHPGSSCGTYAGRPTGRPRGACKDRGMAERLRVKISTIPSTPPRRGPNGHRSARRVFAVLRPRRGLRLLPHRSRRQLRRTGDWQRDRRWCSRVRQGQRHADPPRMPLRPRLHEEHPRRTNAWSPSSPSRPTPTDRRSRIRVMPRSTDLHLLRVGGHRWIWAKDRRSGSAKPPPEADPRRAARAGRHRRSRPGPRDRQVPGAS